MYFNALFLKSFEVFETSNFDFISRPILEPIDLHRTSRPISGKI